MHHVLTILHASSGKRLTKTYSPTTVESYPLVKRFSSREIILSGDDWPNVLAQHLKDVSIEGDAILKGRMDRILNNESRQGATLKEEPNSLFVLDVDGIEVPKDIYRQPVAPEKLNLPALKTITEYLVNALPECFRQVSYVAHASASMGMKGTVHMHLFFMLKRPVTPAHQKNILKGLNLVCPLAFRQCRLTESKMALHMPFDPSLGENSRIIYIAAPLFINAHDPIFADAHIFAVTKPEPHINVRALKDAVVTGRDIPRELKLMKDRLRGVEGLPSVTYTTINQTDLLGQTNSVIVDPDRVPLIEVGSEGKYVRYNVGSGDSNAYWVHKEDPRIVHNFKGEPSFLFAEADPEGYKRHCDRYPFDEETAATEEYSVPFCFYEPPTKTFYAGRRKLAVDELIECYKTNRNDIPVYLGAYGAEVPEPIPLAVYQFRPDDSRSFALNDGFINRYVPPPLLADPVQIPEQFHHADFTTSVSKLKELCPSIYKVLFSLIGCGVDETAHFLNWLGFIVQYRQRTQTLWLFHGTEGTGKGLFHEHVLRPIFQNYVKLKTQHEMEERYNTDITESLVFILDEARLTKTKEVNLLNRIKSMITESTIVSRSMYSEGTVVKNYCSMILFSNDDDAIKISDADRRCNIAPRQQVPLYKRYPELNTPKLPATLTREAAAFASFLLHMNVDDEKVRVPIKNEAKEHLHENTCSDLELFLGMLHSGDVDSLLEALENDPMLIESNNNGYTNQIIKGFQLIRDVAGNIDAAIDNPAYYTKLEIKCLFAALGGRPSFWGGKFNSTVNSVLGPAHQGRPTWQDVPFDKRGYRAARLGHIIQWRTSKTAEELETFKELYELKHG